MQYQGSRGELEVDGVSRPLEAREDPQNEEHQRGNHVQMFIKANKLLQLENRALALARAGAGLRCEAKEVLQGARLRAAGSEGFRQEEPDFHVRKFIWRQNRGFEHHREQS